MRLRSVYILLVYVSMALSNQLMGSMVIATYDVSNAKDEVHGLWTHGTLGLSNPENRYWGFDTGELAIYDDGTATLIASVTNVNGAIPSDTASINLTFSDYFSTDDSKTDAERQADLNSAGIAPKTGGGSANLLDWEYFKAVAGTISFSNGTVVDVLSMPATRALQVGHGANDKDPELGASAWIIASVNGTPVSGGHWDLNMGITETPEPATLIIWSMICAIGMSYRFCNHRWV